MSKQYPLTGTLVLALALATASGAGCDDDSTPIDPTRVDAGKTGPDSGSDGAIDAAEADAPHVQPDLAPDAGTDGPIGSDGSSADGDEDGKDAAGNGSDGSDGSAGASDAPPPVAKVITGAFPLYHLPQAVANAKPRNDASGIVFLPTTKQLLLIDDGGEDASPDVVPFYLATVANLFAPPVTVNPLPVAGELATALPARHRDMEALAFDGSFIYVMSSLPAASEKAEPGYRAFSRFKLVGTQIAEDKTIEPRDAIMAALAKPTAEPWFAAWLDRWKDQKAKDGGLNVEAISATPTAGQLLVALRSPHYSANYLTPQPSDATKKQTRVGAAMLVKLNVASFDVASLAAEVHTSLDLGGLGFRGMEYSPTANGYFITAGAVEAGFDYGFYFWNGQPGKAPVALSDMIPGWKQLCRPESVSEVEYAGKHYLLVLSEESGAICETPAAPFNYLLIELDPAFLHTLE